MSPETLARRTLALVAKARALVADHPAAALALAHRGPRAERTAEPELARIEAAVLVAKVPAATAAWKEAAAGWWAMATCAACERICGQEARRHQGLLEEEDLRQEALIGCYQAARRFDPARGIPFSTFARWWARARIRRAIETDGRVVRLPGQAATTAILARSIANRATDNGSPLTHDELAAEVGQTPDGLRQLFAASAALVSLDTPFSDDPDAGRIGDVLLVAESDPVDAVHQSRVGDAIGALPERERDLMARRMDGTTLRELAADMGLSKERIRQLETRAIGEIRARMGLDDEPVITRRPGKAPVSKRQVRKQKALAVGRSRAVAA